MIPRYRELADREARFWGAGPRWSRAPQVWEDPVLQEIFFGAVERRFLERAAACGPRVLELGCGQGELVLELARRGRDVTAIDLSEELIQVARGSAGPGRPLFLVADLNVAELPPGPFDCVIAHDALHHILELDRLLEQVEHVLAPSGSLLVLDFSGMQRWARVLAALLYAALPTYVPYREKWGLRHRLPAFLASEQAKRQALELGDETALHEGSPFEGISQESIVPAIARRFALTDYQEFLPFWWYLAPKLRVPAWLRYPMARRFRDWDDGLQRLRLARGAYFMLEAKRRHGGT